MSITSDSQGIVAVELTTDDVGDISAVPDLLDQIEGSVASVTADGAYDADWSTMNFRDVTLRLM